MRAPIDRVSGTPEPSVMSDRNKPVRKSVECSTVSLGYGSTYIIDLDRFSITFSGMNPAVITFLAGLNAHPRKRDQGRSIATWTARLHPP